MTRADHDFAGYAELPIPEDARPGPGWTDRMLEMAEHIGAYRTLQLIDRFGGMRIYIPKDPERGKAYGRRGSIVDVVGIGVAAKLSAVYGSEYFHFPTAKAAVNRAKRAPILAAVRDGTMTGAAAARMLGTARPYLSHLVNETDEGKGGGAIVRRADPERRDPSQMDMFGDDEGP
jgi:hypothetical protein